MMYRARGDMGKAKYYYGLAKDAEQQRNKENNP
jgi:hypothetical protein